MTPQDQFIQSQVGPMLEPGERVLYTAHVRRQPGLFWQIVLIGGLLLVLMTKVYFAILTDRRLILIRTKGSLWSGSPKPLNLGVEQHDARAFTKLKTSGFANNRALTFEGPQGKMTLRISPWMKAVSGTKDFFERVPDLINSGRLRQLGGAPQALAPLPAAQPQPAAQQQYGAQQQYAAPPAQQYAAPAQPAVPHQPQYGVPQAQYGAPPQHYAAPPGALAPGARVMVSAPDGQRYPATIMQMQNGHCLCAMQNGQFWIPDQSVSLA